MHLAEVHVNFRLQLYVMSEKNVIILSWLNTSYHPIGFDNMSNILTHMEIL